MMKNNYRRDVDWENEKDTHVLFTGTNYKERQDKKKKNMKYMLSQKCLCSNDY